VQLAKPGIFFDTNTVNSKLSCSHQQHGVGDLNLYFQMVMVDESTVF
jgi:hypothetical protein